jgi:hypothetical protein
MAIGCGPDAAIVPGTDDVSSTGTVATTEALEGSDSSDSGEETGEAPMPPMPDCTARPTDFATPLWEWMHPEPTIHVSTDLHVLPVGELLWRGENGEIWKWTPQGEPAIVVEPASGEWWSALDTTPFGAPIVAGHVEAAGEPAALQLLRLSATGARQIDRRYDDAPGDGQSPSMLTVGPTGDAFVSVYWLQDESRHLQRYDAELERIWSVDRDPDAYPAALAADAAGQVHVASLVIGDGSMPGVYVWDGRVDTYGPEGELVRAISFELVVDNLPRIDLHVGDRMYLLSSGHMTSPSTLFAWDLDGALAFSRSSEDADPFRTMHGMVASPCGGAYLVGRAAVDGVGTVAAMWHVDADGNEGPVHAIVDETPEGERYHSADRIAISPLDEVVVLGTLGPDFEIDPTPLWMRAY